MKNREDFIRFDEPQPYPLRSLTYLTEHVRTNDVRVHRQFVYNGKVGLILV